MPLAGKRGVPSAAVASRSAGLFGHVLEACPLLGGGGSICGSRQPFCWAVQTCARGQREARGVWVWLIYGWKQARKFDWNRTRVWLVPAGPLVRYFRTNYSSKELYLKKSPNSRAVARSPGRTCFAIITAAHATKIEFGVAWS
jgi:hypothetical protein